MQDAPLRAHFAAQEAIVRPSTAAGGSGSTGPLTLCWSLSGDKRRANANIIFAAEVWSYAGWPKAATAANQLANASAPGTS